MPYVSAGLVKAFWQFAEGAGVPEQDLRSAAGIAASSLDDGSAPVSALAINGILRALYLHTRDPAVGMRLGEAVDARTLGFWGYALISCLSLRQRLQMHMHYQRLLDHIGRIGLRVEGERALIDWSYVAPPQEWMPYLPLHYDFAVTSAVLSYTRAVGTARAEAELDLPYPEQPHHARLRALIKGSVVFDARKCQMRVPTRELDRRLLGDAYLLELARRELDKRIAGFGRVLNGDLSSEVRQRIAGALSEDASIVRVARDLRLSTRTLRRRLRAAGQSFQELVEEARREHAVSYLVETDHSVKEIAGRLGYRDPSNFRRAFQRWTGQTPVEYRSTHRAHG